VILALDKRTRYHYYNEMKIGEADLSFDEMGIQDKYS